MSKADRNALRRCRTGNSFSTGKIWRALTRPPDGGVADVERFQACSGPPFHSTWRLGCCRLSRNPNNRAEQNPVLPDHRSRRSRSCAADCGAPSRAVSRSWFLAKADDKVGRRLSDHHGCELLQVDHDRSLVGQIGRARRNQKMQPWDMLRREIRRIPYKLVLALSANFIGSLSYGREIIQNTAYVVKAFALIYGALRRVSYSLSNLGPLARTVPKTKSQEAVRIPRNADPNALPDFDGIAIPAPEP